MPFLSRSPLHKLSVFDVALLGPFPVNLEAQACVDGLWNTFILKFTGLTDCNVPNYKYNK